MDMHKRDRMKDLNTEDLLSIFDTYLKKVVAQDLSCIHGKEAFIIDAGTPWGYKLAA